MSVRSGSWSVSWSGARDRTSGIAHYVVVRGASAPEASCQGRAIWRGRGDSFGAPIERAGAPIFYRVCAVDRAGNASGSGAIMIPG